MRVVELARFRAFDTGGFDSFAILNSPDSRKANRHCATLWVCEICHVNEKVLFLLG